MREPNNEIPFCPWEPTPKQRLFLERRELEVFFGGAAGGGKSVALLMAALEHVRHSGYAALIIRKDFPRLALAGGLIPRSHEWFTGHGMRWNNGPRWNHTRRQWQFPVDCGPPATITFGYLSRPLDKFRYASSEFQYIAFDELTDFLEDDYLFLFSRLRKNTSLNVPLRIRSASNPGGLGHLWVKERFITDESAASHDASKVFHKHGHIYIPSRIADNEHLSEEEYRQSLSHLPAVPRERLMNGDWTVQEKGLIHAEWLRYYVEQDGQMELLDPSGRLVATIPEGACRRFVTIDPAGTSAERTREAKGGQASWTVMQVWDQPRRELARFLILRHQVRRQVGFGELCDLIREIHREWHPERIWIEGEKLGRAAWDSLRFELPIECLPIGVADKSTRSGPLQIKLEKGEVFLPKHETTWRPKFEAELLAWTGDERQPADQIDAAAYAAIVVRDHPSGPIHLIL